jgi:hypothetical protein
MSRRLLNFLNGGKNGKFRDCLNRLPDSPNIAWYPSAGADFRALLYLNRAYSRWNPASVEEHDFPQVFLFTDYFPWQYSPFLDQPMIHNDFGSVIRVEKIEELPSLQLPLDKEIVEFTEGSIATTRVIYLELSVWSNKLGPFDAAVVYAFVENEAFCSRVLLEKESTIAEVVHVRYGGGLGGGGKASGGWIPNVLKKLNTRVFITDGSHYLQQGDKFAVTKYPNLAGDAPNLEQIRTIPGKSWSEHGDVSWYLVS